MDIDQYKTDSGAYKSPKNGKEYLTAKSFRAHMSFRKTENTYTFDKIRGKKASCKYCGRETLVTGHKRHEDGCYLNPKNIRHCEVCGKPILNFRVNKATCSRACANVHFRSGEDNGNWKNDAYRTTCFEFHEKKCVVCGEQHIVAVHHLDEDPSNNSPENLIPLCPTHHQYWHSRYRSLIEQTVVDYVSNWNKLRVA